MKLLLQQLCGMLICAAVSGQIFEAASVKVASGSARTSMRGGPGTGDPGRITYNSVTLASVLQRAYDVQGYQVAGPDWLSTKRYDIAATLAEGSGKEQFQAMLQSLVADRFGLALHHETRQLRGFELLAGKSGPKWKPAAPSEPPPAELTAPPKTDGEGFPVFRGPGLVLMEGVRGRAVVVFLRAQAQPVAKLVELLTREFRLPILDKTGLAGTFDFTLEFAPQAPGALETAPADADAAPNLTAAVQEQLGLQLRPAKIATDVLVVDRGSPVPTGN